MYQMVLDKIKRIAATIKVADDQILLYHGSKSGIEGEIGLHSRKQCDFGKGFYLTFMRSQSERYGERFKSQGETAIMNIYEFDDIRPNFTHKIFPEYNAEWLDFVALCRKGINNEMYDVIEGGVADDKVFNTIDLYFAGIYTREQALDQLLYKKPNHQICIASQIVLDNHLHFIESIKL